MAANHMCALTSQQQPSVSLSTHGLQPGNHAGKHSPGVTEIAGHAHLHTIRPPVSSRSRDRAVAAYLTHPKNCGHRSNLFPHHSRHAHTHTSTNTTRLSEAQRVDTRKGRWRGVAASAARWVHPPAMMMTQSPPDPPHCSSPKDVGMQQQQTAPPLLSSFGESTTAAAASNEPNKAFPPRTAAAAGVAVARQKACDGCHVRKRR
jgi:hypothetical protein